MPKKYSGGKKGGGKEMKQVDVVGRCNPYVPMGQGKKAQNLPMGNMGYDSKAFNYNY